MLSERLRLLPEMVSERLRLLPVMLLSERLRLLPVMVSELLRLLPEMASERLRLFPEMFLSERLRLLPELVSERLRLLPEILLSPSYHPILAGDFELYLVAMTVHIFSATLSSVVSSFFSRPECPARFLTFFCNSQQVIVLGRSQS